MVYDITREESFKELKKFWYKQVKEFGNPSASKVIILLEY
jgi:GTPase SAR1 family protein